MIRNIVAVSIAALIGAWALTGCGSDSEGSDTGTATTYRLKSATDPINNQDGSFVAYTYPPNANAGPVVETSTTGTMKVRKERLESSDILLSYCVIGIDLVLNNGAAIAVHGDDVGRVQLLVDGTLKMELHDMPFVGGPYELSSIYNPRPGRYHVENGNLVFRGVNLSAAPWRPTYGSPTLVLWADPED